MTTCAVATLGFWCCRQYTLVTVVLCVPGPVFIAEPQHQVDAQGFLGGGPLVQFALLCYQVPYIKLALTLLLMRRKAFPLQQTVWVTTLLPTVQRVHHWGSNSLIPPSLPRHIDLSVHNSTYKCPTHNRHDSVPWHITNGAYISLHAHGCSQKSDVFGAQYSVMLS